MLASVKSIATEIIVLDTGSNDKTKEIALSGGAHVETFQWHDDFSAARNHLRSLAKSDWILILDADERIEDDNGEKILQAIASKNKAFQCSILNVLSHPVIDSLIPLTSVRLFQRNSHIHYEGRVHETIEHSLRKMTQYAVQSEINIHNYGFSIEAPSVRRMRNRRIFESELQRDPTDANIRFQLAMDYYLNEDFPKAEEYMMFLMSSQSHEMTTPTRASLLTLIAEMNRKQGKSMLARSNAQKAIQMSNNLFAHYIQAQTDVDNNLYDNAIRRLLEIDLESMSNNQFRVRKGQLFTEIARYCLKMNKYDKALQYVELVKEEDPSYDAMFIGGYLLEQQKNYARALEFYEVALFLKPDSKDIVARIETTKNAMNN